MYNLVSPSVNFASYFSCDSPKDYFITVLDTDLQALDTINFRKVLNSDLDQSWYLSATFTLTSDTISWIGHGSLADQSFIYLETVQKSNSGQYEHLSLLTFDLSAVTPILEGSASSSNVKGYPITLVSNSGTSIDDLAWSMVAEVEDSYIMIL